MAMAPDEPKMALRFLPDTSNDSLEYLSRITAPFNTAEAYDIFDDHMMEAMKIITPEGAIFPAPSAECQQRTKEYQGGLGILSAKEKASCAYVAALLTSTAHQAFNCVWHHLLPSAVDAHERILSSLEIPAVPPCHVIAKTLPHLAANIVKADFAPCFQKKYQTRWPVDPCKCHHTDAAPQLGRECHPAQHSDGGSPYHNC
jgi:hypothetical protein